MERDKLISLVTKAQQGDPDSLNELFNAFYNDVYYFALKTVKDDQLACDITQESFCEILNTLGNLQEPAAFVTWMKQITYHQCTRYFKKKQDVIVDEDEDGNTIFDTLQEEKAEFIPDEALDQAEFKQTIMAMIDELSEEQRAAVMMFYYDELPIKAIAQIQGVSENTVKSRLNYAKKGIKKSVENYEKKNGVKLRCAGVLPLLLWLFKDYFAQAAPVSATVVAEGVAASTGTAVTISATATTTATVTTATTATAAVGIGAKIAALPIATKVLAGIVATTIVVGGAATAIVVPDWGKDFAPIPTVSTESTESISLTEDTTENTAEVTAPTETMAATETMVATETTHSTEVTQPTEATQPAEATKPTEDPVPEHTPYLVPAGGKYTCANGKVYNAGENVTIAPQTGDKFETVDYTYLYNYEMNTNWETNTIEWTEFLMDGWGMVVNDKTKISYAAPEQSINGYPVTSLSHAFMGCANMPSAPQLPASTRHCNYAFAECTALEIPPVIPEGVMEMNSAFIKCIRLTKTPYLPDSVENISNAFTECTALKTVTNFPAKLKYMSSAFNMCENLVDVPQLPNTVEELSWAFQACFSLTKAPAIPATVRNMHATFMSCSSLTGTVEIHAQLREDTMPCNNTCGLCASGQVEGCVHCVDCCSYSDCFGGLTELPITLIGTCPKLQQIAATALNGNVVVG